MKVKLYFFIILSFITTCALAQVPAFFNTNAAGGANSFPLNNSAASRKVQWFIPPNSLGAVPPGNNITDVYFQAGSTATRLYPNLIVKLKTGSGTGLTGVGGGPVEPGMTTVYSGVNQTIASTLGNWIKITLTTPWLYNPNLPLIVELEHDATSGTGPTLYQSTNIPGPGNGRQWADYNWPTISGVGTNQINFGIDVIPATPCNGAPPANSILPANYTTCVGINNPTLVLASTYTLGDLTYQWESSTVSQLGPFSPIPGATLSSAPVPTLGVTTWFQAVVTCTNLGGGITVLAPTQFSIAGTMTNTTPYFEDFEGILGNNRLPNCSWTSPNIGGAVKTWTNSQTGNRLPFSGNKFATFESAGGGTNYYYSNGIWLDPGITYSASLRYQTDFTGATNWSDLSILAGTAQTPAGLVTVASSNGPAVSPIYKVLGNTFTVSTSGLYFMAVRATASSGGAQFLSWDDLSVTVPCTGNLNPVNLTLNVNTTSLCTGTSLNMSASGADTYTWSNGVTGSAISITPNATAVFSVTGTNQLTGCTGTGSQLITVKESPNVSVFAFPAVSCAGSPVNLVAGGAATYTWSSGGNSPGIVVSPITSTGYTVLGTANGCTAKGVFYLNVNNLPNVTAFVSSPAICRKEAVILSGTGAQTYKWYSNASSNILQGANPSVVLLQTGQVTFTMVGTDANECSGIATTNVIVDECTGLNYLNFNSGAVKIYPNPNNGEFTLQLSSKADVEIMDLSGRIVFTANQMDTETKLDLSHLSAGIYHVKVKSEITVNVVKLIKE